AAAPAAAPADAAAPTKEVIENPYGLDALWKTGDFIAKGTLVIMAIMSMGSWYILITKIIDQVKLSGQATDARTKFWKAASVQAG
ncbi:MotA/TolQ/ExbB proton channel family protein, partial [Undibacterium sp. SXout11W]